MSRVVVEWVFLSNGIITEFDGPAETLVSDGVTAATSAGTGGANTPNGGKCLRITAFDGPSWVQIGSAPVATSTTGMVLLPGQTILMSATAGSKVSALAATSLQGSGISPVTGTFSATGQSASFKPAPGKDFNLVLGTPNAATSTVQLERSFDGGTTWIACTYIDGSPIAWSVGINTAWSDTEVGVLYRLNCTAYSVSTTYRLSQ